MALIEFLQSKAEGSESFLGKAECNGENLGNMFLGMMSSMGMANPGSLTSRSAKGIKITKKGNTYTLYLMMFKPPVKITWTGIIPMQKLTEVLSRVSTDSKSVGFVNTIKTNDGNSFFQLAVA